MNVARWVRRVAFTGAAAVGAAALVSGATSTPSSAAARPNVFNIYAHAWGVRVDPDTNPEPFPLQDAFNEAFPYTNSSVQAGGVSEGDAQSFYAGSEQTPALLCSFIPGGACDKVPFPAQAGPFPPNYPFEAHATYPVTPKADAPASGHEFGSQTSANTLTAAPTHAEAAADSASAVSAATNGTFLPGTPLALSAGSASASTQQSFVGSTAVTRSEATVHDVNIAGVIHIASATSITEIDNDGQHKPVNKSSVTVSGVSANGHGAIIDEKGIHLLSQGIAPTLFNQLSAQLSQKLKGLGISVTTVGTQSTSVDAHTLQAQGAGVQVNFSRSFTELCGVASVLCKGLPPLCKQQPFPLNQQPLLDVCRPPVPSPSDTYLLSTELAFTSASNSASFYSYTPPPFVPGGVLPGVGAGGPTTTFVPGTPGTSGTPGLGGASDPSLGGTQQPSVAQDNNGNGGLAGYAENLGNVAKRLKYLMPLLGLVAIGVLAGRLGRAPARLPTLPQ